MNRSWTWITIPASGTWIEEVNRKKPSGSLPGMALGGLIGVEKQVSGIALLDSSESLPHPLNEINEIPVTTINPTKRKVNNNFVVVYLFRSLVKFKRLS